MNLYKVKNYWTILGKVIKREFYRITTRKSLSTLYFVLPVVLFVFFSLVYSNELVRGIPIAIFDEDHSELSLLLTRYANSASSMKIVKYVNSMDELKSEFRKGNVRGAFYFPKDMEKDVKSGKQADVTLFINSSNIIVSNYLLSDGSKIIKMVSGGVLLKKLRSSGLMEDQAMNIISPIKIETMVLYNPNYSYVNYLAPGLTTFAYLMIIMVASVLILSSEFTHNTFNELLKLSENKISIIILGKSLPHIVIHIINLIILVGIVFPIFNIKIHSSWVTVLLFLIFFSIVVFALGFMISSLFRDQMFATELALFVVTPAFIFSGLTYPLWAMPWLFRFVADLIPYTHFLSGFTKLAQMGVPFRYVIPETIYLIIFLLISIITTVIALRYQIKKSLLIDEGVK